jgi:hypothetical protein
MMEGLGWQGDTPNSGQRQEWPNGRERERGGIHGKKNNIRLEGEKVEWFSLISGPRGKTIISVG